MILGIYIYQDPVTGIVPRLLGDLAVLSFKPFLSATPVRRVLSRASACAVLFEALPLLCACVAPVASPAFAAQKVDVRGRAVNEQGAALAGARVCISGLGLCDSTGTDGRFAFVASIDGRSVGVAHKPLDWYARPHLDKPLSAEILDTRGRRVWAGPVPPNVRSTADALRFVRRRAGLPRAVYVVRMQFRRGILQFTTAGFLATGQHHLSEHTYPDALSLKKRGAVSDSVCVAKCCYGRVCAALDAYEADVGEVVLSERAGVDSCALYQEEAEDAARRAARQVSQFIKSSPTRGLAWDTTGCVVSYGDTATVELNCTYLGGYDLIETTARTTAAQSRIRTLAYLSKPDTVKSNITFSSGRGLVMAEGTTIEGTVTLAGSCVKMNQNRTCYTAMLDSTTIALSPALPFDSSQVDVRVDRMQQMYETYLTDPAIERIDGTANFRGTLAGDTPLAVTGDCHVDDAHLEGKVVACSKTLWIGENVHCSYTRFYARRIVILGGVSDMCAFYAPYGIAVNGGTHSSQFFASDFITVGRAATTTEHCVWVVRHVPVANNEPAGGSVVFEDSCVAAGCAIDYAVIDPLVGRGVRDRMLLGTGTLFRGFLISDYDADIKHGTIEGHLWVPTVATTFEGLQAKGWLFDVHIGPAGGDPPFPMFGETSSDLRYKELTVETWLR